MMYVFSAKDGSGDIEVDGEVLKFEDLESAISWAQENGVSPEIFEIQEVMVSLDGSIFAPDELLPPPVVTAQDSALPPFMREGFEQYNPEPEPTEEEKLRGAGTEERMSKLPEELGPGVRATASELFPYMSARVGAGEEVSLTSPGTYSAAARDILSLPGRTGASLFTGGDVGTTGEDIGQVPLFSGGTLEKIARDPVTGAGALVGGPAFAATRGMAPAARGLTTGLAEGTGMGLFEYTTEPGYSDDDFIMDVLISGGIGAFLGGGTQLVKNKMRQILGNQYTEETAERLLPKLRASKGSTERELKRSTVEGLEELGSMQKEAGEAIRRRNQKGLVPLYDSKMGGRGIYDLGASRPQGEISLFGRNALGPVPNLPGQLDYRRSLPEVLDQFKSKIVQDPANMGVWNQKINSLGTMIKELEDFSEMAGRKLNLDDLPWIAKRYAKENPEAVRALFNQVNVESRLTPEMASKASKRIQELSDFAKFLENPIQGASITTQVNPFGLVKDIANSPYLMKSARDVTEPFIPVAPVSPFYMRDE